MASTGLPQRAARRIELHGIVQGVGFRPYVYRLAHACGLEGTVRNRGGDVVIDAFGDDAALSDFLDRLPRDTPPGARVTEMRSEPLDTAPTHGFAIVASEPGRSEANGIVPDLATCPDCLSELFDPGDRRHRYPFLNCTACGPRATVIEDLPYDRERTTMRGFTMCAACRSEYDDPEDRRFHAEPTACPECGPRLSWQDGVIGESALQAAVACIEGGGLVAVKGVGGYQAVCDAGNEETIARLRLMKARPVKALAVMVPDVDTARRIAEVDGTAEALLRSAAAPIVLLRGRHELSRSLAPGSHRLGLFLPYSPLHHLLLRELDRPLVVTSANLPGEPTIIDDDELVAKLGPAVDGILGHDRPIAARYDDSVAHVVDGRPRLLRRARGYAPAPLPLPAAVAAPLLAVGAQSKHTAAIAVGRQAVLGPHTGDLSSAASFDAFTGVVASLDRLYGADPAAVAADLHPDYLSTRFADRLQDVDHVGVQHHHAHVVACAAEHGVRAPFVGVAYDGLGYGADGGLWGGEILIADYTDFHRVGRLAAVPLPGGERAVRRPARMAMAYLFGAEPGLGRIDLRYAAPFLNRMNPAEVEGVRQVIENGTFAPRASSAGRLFDAAASLLGLCDDNTFEGEAALWLEAAADGWAGRALPWEIVKRRGMWVFDPAVTLQAMLAAVRTQALGLVAARFHASVAEATAALVRIASYRAGTDRVCLGGGVFANRLLAESVIDLLREGGCAVYLGEQVPPGDGGIAYGQAAVLAARRAAGVA